MMEVFIFSFLVILLAVAGMAVGFLFGGQERCIRGSCGGIARIPGMEGECCGGCDKEAEDGGDSKRT
uniref:(Na+)-NQR maturation NqrM n=1 Tax=Candidatus Kentrum sp. MB TaxID=2138164 RepID=A0A450XRJ1_9GAMM|nr:MAG: hypothetical protein BECKMB1821I_GA0114274_10287 [Candidatus Kentron sp. MB]VFK77325.1 MAG: hypothetical protein BECKMB1821H_GA0114242_11237 [Candidatus Kentron sp. MB]